ncbi:MAG: hypothetical protein ABI155_11185 [Paralcaligenes sp.]
MDGAITGIDPFFLPSFAQDAPNWLALVGAWPGEKNVCVALLAFCRRWEDALRGRLALPPQGVFESALRVKLRECLDESIPGPEWVWANETGFETPPLLPLSAALAMLETYRECWLEGGGGEGWSDQEFDRWFPWLFLAMTIVSEVGAEAPVLQTIALTYTARTPSFFALDLWLQRRAGCACVRRKGIAFVVEHFEDLRLEVLASALLREAFHIDDLKSLLKLFAERQHEEMSLTVEELVAATEHNLVGHKLVE